MIQTNFWVETSCYKYFFVLFRNKKNLCVYYTRAEAWAASCLLFIMFMLTLIVIVLLSSSINRIFFFKSSTPLVSAIQDSL